MSSYMHKNSYNAPWEESFGRILTPLEDFIHKQTTAGKLLIASTVVALIIANSPLAHYYHAILHTHFTLQIGNWVLDHTIHHWINDGLMAIFFFLIGLEIKREVLIGELNSLKKASLPVFAAIGGMLVPLFMYLLINTNPATTNGWGISMATDIAFTLAILKLLGKNLPLSLKIFLTAFAIIDDIGAVLIIALFYTSELSWILFLYAGILLGILYVLSYLKIHNKYLLLGFGILIWFLFLKSGIHPTIAGILIAFSVPIRQRINEFEYTEKLSDITERLTESTNTNKLPVLSKIQIEEIDNLEDWTDKVQSPLQQLEHRLHKWVAFLIIPVFALSNAGISFSSNMEIDMSLILTIAISLFAGKTIGVSLFSYLSIRLKISSLPQNVNFKQIIGVAILSGVGFTMSLFISGLAFYDEPIYLNSAKIGIILGSLISGIIGFIILKQKIPKRYPTNRTLSGL